jgi:hypothetical protein
MNTGSVFVLLAVVLGSVLTLITQVLLELVRDSRKAEQLSHAIAGEISALLQIVEGREYIASIRAHHALALAGTPILLKVHLEQKYFSVIEANLQNIGLLPAELPLLIPKFLTLSKSVIEDISALRAGDWDARTPGELAGMYGGLNQVLEAAMSTGRQIVVLIATIYASPHGRYPLELRIRMFFWGVFRRIKPKSSEDAALPS